MVIINAPRICDLQPNTPFDIKNLSTLSTRKRGNRYKKKKTHTYSYHENQYIPRSAQVSYFKLVLLTLFCTYTYFIVVKFWTLYTTYIIILCIHQCCNISDDDANYLQFKIIIVLKRKSLL